jgi:hypothetical protein
VFDEEPGEMSLAESGTSRHRSQGMVSRGLHDYPVEHHTEGAVAD